MNQHPGCPSPEVCHVAGCHERSGCKDPKKPVPTAEGERRELVGRITEYLSVGGLFNPELMEHDKVRDLLMDCRSWLDKLKIIQ